MKTTSRQKGPRRTKPWKQNIIKIPTYIRDKVKSAKEDDIIVAGVKLITPEDISQGLFSHLKLMIENGKPVYPKRVLPPAWIGRYSKMNVDGKEIVRKDLPKIDKSRSMVVPNWGDWSKGEHDVEIPYEAYERDFLFPKGLYLVVDLLKEEQKGFVFRFSVDEILSKKQSNFEAELLFFLNLLLENTGSIDVFPKSATELEYLNSVEVPWEILPPDDWDRIIERMLSDVDPDKRKHAEEILLERKRFFEKIRPEKVIRGKLGFRGYWGAVFSEKLVVFENIAYGNAIFVMFEDWETLSKMTKSELFKTRRVKEDFIRLVHTGDWKKRLKAIISEK